jgi:hypothetical protein
VGIGERESETNADEEPVMSLSTTLDQLKKTLSRNGAERTYAEARARYRALVPYETVGAALATIDRGSPASIAERDAVLAALVTELQLSPCPLWESLLLVSFTPMLLRLRSRVGRRSSEDLDQSVLLAFLETARTLRFRSYVARNLYLLTQERIFTERNRERRAPESLVFEEETYAADPFRGESASSLYGARSTPDAHQRAAVDEVAGLVEAEGGVALRELLLATYDGRQSVKEYVDRMYPDRDKIGRARVGKHLLRARTRVFAKLCARAERRERAFERAA